MITAIELSNRIKEYRARAVELQSDAPNYQSEDTREAMLYFAEGYEFMSNMMEKAQKTEEHPLLN